MLVASLAAPCARRASKRKPLPSSALSSALASWHPSQGRFAAQGAAFSCAFLTQERGSGTSARSPRRTVLCLDCECSATCQACDPATFANSIVPRCYHLRSYQFPVCGQFKPFVHRSELQWIWLFSAFSRVHRYRQLETEMEFLRDTRITASNARYFRRRGR